jgi:hypothetical protein
MQLEGFYDIPIVERQAGFLAYLYVCLSHTGSLSLTLPGQKNWRNFACLFGAVFMSGSREFEISDRILRCSTCVEFSLFVC